MQMKKYDNIQRKIMMKVNEKRAITLIALVITIIILLILAGVTIAAITGENGLFANAQYAKFANSYTIVKENVELYIYNNAVDKLGDNFNKYPITEEKVTQISDSLKNTIEHENGTEINKENLNLYKIDMEKIKVQDKNIYVLDIDTAKIYLLEGVKIGESIYHIPSLKLKNQVNGYILSFDSNGGTCDISSKTIKSNEQYGILPKPEKEGYIFLGWYTDLENGNKIQETDIITGNVTVYAKWKEEVGLIAWYDGLDNTSNGHDYETNTWTDLTGNNQLGATLNGGEWARNGLIFDGDDWVNLNSILIPEKDKFSIEIVMSMSSYQDEYGFIIGQNTQDINNNRFGLMYDRAKAMISVQNRRIR